MGLTKVLLIFFCLLLPINFAHAEDTIDVTFVSCCSSNGFFWPKVESFMHAAAEDLNIELEVIHANMNHIRMKEIAVEVAHRENPPDYLIIDNYKLIAGTIIKAIDDTGVKVFLMANGLTSEQLAIFEKPREKYKNWIGELTPNNHLIGFNTAHHLITEAPKNNDLLPKRTLNLIALSGDDKTPAGLQRIDGLKEAVANYPNVVLQQIIPCHWQQDEADKKIRWILKRYPKTNLIWSANDEMALGAMEGAVAVGKHPGSDIFFVGVNWKKEALLKITDDTMLASGGGHFTLGGWTLILLYDYHKGRDFSDEGLQLDMNFFELLDGTNIDNYLSVYGDEDWRRIDFTSYSKVFNPDTERYDFRLPHFLTRAD